MRKNDEREEMNKQHKQERWNERYKYKARNKEKNREIEYYYYMYSNK